MAVQDGPNIIIHKHPMMKLSKFFKIKQNIIYGSSKMAHI